jgi:hypothetical protein
LDKREARLVADRVKAPQFSDVDLVFDTESSCDLDRGRRNVQMERRTHASEMRPLRHRLEVVHRLASLDLDYSFKPLAAIRCRQHEIRKHLTDTHPNPGGLLVANIECYVVSALQTSLQEPDDPIVLQLFAYGSHQDGTHGASRLK